MKIQIVLDLSNTSDADIVIVADTYCNNISAASNPNFVAPLVSAQVAANIAAQVTTTRASITTLKNALSAATSDVKTDAIRSSRAALDINVGILANLIANVANAPTVLDINREGIVHSAGMQIKSTTKRQKQQFTAKKDKDTPVGTVVLVAKGKANAHIWEYSTNLVDPSKDRVQLEPTTAATIEVEGLSEGVKYAFFHKPVTPKGPHAWEGPVFFIVS